MRRKISISIIVICVLTIGLFAVEGRPAEVIEWMMQAHNTPGEPGWEYVMSWTEDIYILSGGRLRITLHPPGAIVPFMEVFSAVAMGTLDLASSWGPFWVGIDPVFGLFCGSAAGMTPHEIGLWRHQWDGWEMARGKYAQYNIHWIPFGTYPAEIFLWAHHPIRTFADLEGLKVRAAGLSLVMFGRLGISAFWIPGGETAPALLKGVVDAAEFLSFPADMGLGFHEVVRYAMVGPRATTVADDLMINMDRWNELPPDLQAIVTTTTLKYQFKTTLWLERLEKEYLARAKEYGVVIVPIAECLAKLVRQTFDEMFDEFAAKCPFFAKVWESQRTFLEEYRELRTIMWPWE